MSGKKKIIRIITQGNNRTKRNGTQKSEII